MFKKQMKFQKSLLLGLLILGGIVFIYSIGLMTDIYNLYPYTSDEVLWYVEGTDTVFYGMQKYNTNLLIASVILIFSVLFNYIVSTNKRRKYYLGNYIMIGVSTLLFLGVAIWIIANTAKYKALYFSSIDFEALNETIADWEITDPYEVSTFWFDLGTVIGVVLIIGGLLQVLNLTWKTFLMKHEKHLLEEGQNGTIK